jgi:2-methylcitrate dehydratase PrpD
LEHFTEEYILEPAVMELAEKISLSPSIPPDKPLGAALKIRMKHGEQLENSVDMPKGNGIFTPLTKEEKREKFLENVIFSKSISLNQAKDALALLEHIEDIENIQKVISMFVP